MTAKDLIPFNKRSEREAKELGSKGGKASGVTRRRQRDMRKAFAALLKKEWTTKNGTMTGAEMLALAKFKKAANGDVRALIDIEDRLYGKPTQAVELTGAEGGPVQVRQSVDLSGVSTENLWKIHAILKGDDESGKADGDA